MAKLSATQIIELLGLSPLPEEGGYFVQTFKSKKSVNLGYQRSALSSIYYLVTEDQFSAFHRVKHDEAFHFYSGDVVELVQIDPSGKLSTQVMGHDLLEGERPQVIVPAMNWQALKLKAGGSWALLGTNVGPGFEYEDFELGRREILAQEFPQHRDLITALCR